jgi:hypothetical protein
VKIHRKAWYVQWVVTKHMPWKSSCNHVSHTWVRVQHMSDRKHVVEGTYPLVLFRQVQNFSLNTPLLLRHNFDSFTVRPTSRNRALHQQCL